MSGNAMQAVRLASRSLARSPGFTVPALAILAIGISAATAIFTVVDSIVFRPLDLPDSDRVVIVCEDHPRLAGACIASPGNTQDFRAAATLVDLGFGRGWHFALSDGDATLGVRGGLATGAFFRALGATPSLGRGFAEDEVGPDRNKVALLSHAFWASRYGADPAAVGTFLEMDGASFEVVGILPEGFDAPFDLGGIQVWTPPHFDPLDPEVRGWRGFRAIGRLASGASVEAARAELTAQYEALARIHEEVNDEWRLRVSPLLDVVVGDARSILIAFLGAAVLLLLIVSANVANLILARGLGRQRELSVRAALGAARSRLVGGIVLEGLLLTLAATAVALALAGSVTRILVLLAPPEIPRLDEVSVNLRVFAFAAAVAVMVTVAFAALPALRVTGWNLADTLKSGTRGGEGRGALRLRSALVVAELGLCVVLLSSAGVLTRSFARYLAWDPGFDRGALLAVSAFADVSKYDSRRTLFTMWAEAVRNIGSVPGVTSVSTASAGPLFGGGDGAAPYVPEGWTESGALPTAEWFDVGPAFFATLGVPVVEGREFRDTDGLDAPRVAVVNEAFVRRSWPEGSALGRVVRFPEWDLALEVVGVVADVVPLTPGEVTRPQIYWPDRQIGRPATFFLVGTSGDPTAVAGAVTEAALRADPDLSLGTPRALVAEERRQLVRPRFQLIVLGAFALAALALSAVGVYAVVAYAVARRAREMGIRMALGATRVGLLGSVLGSSLGIALVGIGLGGIGVFATGRVLGRIAHGVGPLDPLSLAGAGAVLLAVTLVASIAPARRATRVDPLDAMRAD